MRSITPLRCAPWWAAAGFIALLAGSRLAAQNVFVAERGDKMYPVVQMREERPLVKADGKLEVASGAGRAFVKAEEYRPVFVAVRNLVVRRSGKNWKGNTINNELHFHAEFETPYPLEDAYFVLEMHTELGGPLLLAYEIGTLEPHNPKLIQLTIPLTDRLGKGRHKLHVFAGGSEVLNSDMPEEHREQVLDRMTAKRIAGVQDAEPQPFVGPAAEYPEKLRKAKFTGKAVIALRVSKTGRVLEPTVKEATDPALGEAALAAVKLWRFLPRVKAGQPVESPIEVPFDFAPPKGTK